MSSWVRAGFSSLWGDFILGLIRLFHPRDLSSLPGHFILGLGQLAGGAACLAATARAGHECSYRLQFPELKSFRELRPKLQSKRLSLLGHTLGEEAQRRRAVHVRCAAAKASRERKAAKQRRVRATITKQRKLGY